MRPSEIGSSVIESCHSALPEGDHCNPCSSLCIPRIIAGFGGGSGGVQNVEISNIDPFVGKAQAVCSPMYSYVGVD